MKQKQSETRKIGLGPMQWATEIVDNKIFILIQRVNYYSNEINIQILILSKQLLLKR